MSTVYLPVEVINRELMARAFLSVRLASDGHKVYIFEHTFFDRNGWAEKGIYIGKNCFRTELPYSKSFYLKMKEKGINLWYLDEEGGIYIGDQSDWEERLLCRINPQDLDSNDKILAWGNWQKKVFKSKKISADVLVSGIPNYEILSPKYKDCLNDWDLEVTGGLKDFILINTRFSLGNPKIGVGNIFNSNQPHSKKLPSLYLENVFISDNQIMFQMIDLCIYIALALPNEQIIIRPHPGENIEIYLLLTKNIKNISVINNGGVESWIRMSKVMIHNGCSTAIQAMIAEKKVITFLPDNMSNQQMKYTPALPNTIGTIAKTYNQVLSALTLSDSSIIDNSWKETISEPSSIEFIANKINNIGFNLNKENRQSLKKNLYIEERVKNAIKQLSSAIMSSFREKQFNYKDFSKINDLVQRAQDYYKVDVECKKITNGCYCVFKKIQK